MSAEKNTSGFGGRLKLARKMAGMSLQELSDGMANIVSKQSLNKYENGLMNPSSEVLIELSKVLNVKPDYFLKKETAELGAISFRKRTGLSKRDEEIVVEKARNYFERFLEIESILNIKNSFVNPLAHLIVNEFNDAEEAARLLREKWELGQNPINNLMEMLELQGVKVFLMDAVDEIDGFATITENNIPLVMINSHDKPIERIRFTIVHELAHILLQLNTEIKENNKLEEQYCHYFSSCFLLPRKQLIQNIGEKRTYINIQELINIKKYYGISLRAIVHRLKKIGVISDNYYTRWMVFMSKKYGQKNEPGDYPGIEESRVFNQLVNRALAEGFISTSKAAELCNLSTNEFRKMSDEVG